jgi:hypothetical protein
MQIPFWNTLTGSSIQWRFRAHLPLLLIVAISTLIPGIPPASGQAASENGRLVVRVIDQTKGRATPVRVRLTRNGAVVPALPAAAVAVMYGLWDHADGYGYQPDSSFYVNGAFALDLPPGPYELALSKGNEYLRQQHTFTIRKGRTHRGTYRLERWITMPERGWYSADAHIHIRRSPREDPLLMSWIQAEDIHVGVLLRMGDFWETYYPQYAWGEKGVYQSGNYLLTSGQEDPRTPELGHALGIGAADRVRYRDEYYYYDNVFDRLHALGGITGYAHQGETFHGYRGLTLDGLRGKVDVLEILQFCASDEPLQAHHYYHLLDLGFPVTAVAGSDFPWCGQDHDRGPPERSAQIGNVRFYTYTGATLSYQTWKAGLMAGHTFVSSGPILDFRVNGHLPGDSLDIQPGDSLTITAHAYGHPEQVPLKRLEIISHGEILRQITADQPGQSAEQLSIRFKIPVSHGVWIAARCAAGPAQEAHTTPVYVTVAGDGFHNPRTMPHYLALSEQYLQELELELDRVRREPDHQASRYREGLQMRIAETRRVIEELWKKLK